jgi:ribose/xylose/arabinose/galactoside ABC-type transport system permease subunit/ABC-type Mn2+/Zn2+ transport system ATPase subunit
MRLHGQSWKPKSPQQALAAGFVYLPEERKRQGLVPDHSVSDSISVGFSDLLSRWGMIQGDIERRRVRSAMSTYDVRAVSPGQVIGTLSGGNQQKAMLARWLERGPDVIVLDEPTRGVDVGAKAEIHQLIDRLAGQGCAVLLISSDLPEVLGMSDRVLVMHRGTISIELRGEQMTQENVLLAASGLLSPRQIEIRSFDFRFQDFPDDSRPPLRSSASGSFFLAGNVVLLLVIAAFMKQGASFAQVLARCGPNVAPVVLAGLGMTGIICAGAIDLSIASIIVVAGTVFGILVDRKAPPWMAFAACAGTAWALSMTNGWLVRRLKVPAIIITLAGLACYRGLALMLADVAIPNFGGSLSVTDEAYHRPGKDFAGWILLLTLGIALLWEWFAGMPRRWLALGSSDEACRLLGLSPGRILQSAFGVGGTFLGLSALIYVTQIQFIEPARMALGFELQVIGAVILGGTNIFGGEGSYAGTVLGALFLYFTSQLMTYAGVNPYFQDAITGAVIMAVIGLDCALHRRRKLLEELA